MKNIFAQLLMNEIVSIIMYHSLSVLAFVGYIILIQVRSDRMFKAYLISFVTVDVTLNTYEYLDGNTINLSYFSTDHIKG